MREYYLQQIEMEQYAINEQALRMQFKDEERAELQSDMEREMYEEVCSYE